MERPKRTIITLLLFLTAMVYGEDFNAEIYKAYISGNMQRWKEITDRFQTAKPTDGTGLARLVNYQYGYIGWCIGTGRNEEAKKYLELAEKNLKTLEKNKAYLSLVRSYESAFYGYRIGMNKMLAPVLGLKSIDAAKEAIGLDDKNPMAWVQYGNIRFYTPQIFGGSKQEALEYYLKALNLMERNNGNNTGDWNYMHLLTLVARAYTYVGDYTSSLKFVDRILAIEPEFKWVKDELYPEIMKKMQN